MTGKYSIILVYLIYYLLKLVFTSGLKINRGVLTTFQDIFVKLRFDLEEVDLAYRFGISQPAVSRIFRKWIGIMAKRLCPLIQWPEELN